MATSIVDDTLAAIGASPDQRPVVETLIGLGVSVDAMRRALEHGRLDDAVIEMVLHPGPEPALVSPREVEARGGLDTDATIELSNALGLPAPGPDEPYFTPEEAEVMVGLGRLKEIWPREAYLQVSRVYGQAMEAIAHTEVQLFRLHVEQSLREAAGDPLVVLPALRDAVAELLPLADPMLKGIHRRLIEHELAQAAIYEVEARSGTGFVSGYVEVTFLFCDLKDFTAYADARGDAAAVAAIELFSSAVTAERRDDGHIVKGLGDGYLLTYSDPAEAVAAGHAIVETLRGEDAPGVHASVHSGLAVFRQGDYFGSAVNLAARLLGAAARDELVATRPVVEATEDRYRWIPRPTEHLRGLAKPVEVWRLGGPR